VHEPNKTTAASNPPAHALKDLVEQTARLRMSTSKISAPTTAVGTASVSWGTLFTATASKAGLVRTAHSPSALQPMERHAVPMAFARKMGRMTLSALATQLTIMVMLRRAKTLCATMTATDTAHATLMVRAHAKQGTVAWTALWRRLLPPGRA